MNAGNAATATVTELAARGTRLLEQETIRRVTMRLIPVLMLDYFCASLDRSNIGMAATTLSTDLGFSNTQFGFGAGVFFFGYFLAEIPSNLILNRVGARRWISRILITWGVLSGLTAFVWNDWSFYGVRFLLGLAEAGFFPGMLLYMTWWFPAGYRSRMTALFMSAGVFSSIIGPPIGGLLLRLNGVLGLAGWQWLFIVEAMPSVIMCFVTWRVLTDRPKDAAWLRPDQQTWLTARLDSERAQHEAIRKYSLGKVLSSPKIWLLTLVEFGHQVAGYGLVFFMPLIVKGLGVATGWIGVVTALPFLCGFVAMIVWGYHSDRTGERTWHAAGALLLVASGLAACIVIGGNNPTMTLIVLCVTVMGNQSVAACFWSIPGTMLTGAAAAGGLAMINSIGNLGGWFGPMLYGAVKDASGSTSLALLFLAVGPLISAIVLILIGHDRRLKHVTPR
jgi:MFS transporter, ACS family, tartrate transporter